MDDNKRPVVEFPFNGGYVAISRPTDSQMMLLALSRTSDEPQKLFRRVLGLLENLIGPEGWQEIEDGMMNASISVESLLKLLGDVSRYKWADLDKGQESEPDPVGSDGPEPPAPAPRVISRG